MNLNDRLFARTRPLHIHHAGKTLNVLSAFLVAFSVWASWATLEEQVQAAGTVIVSSRSQIIQAVDGGVLSKLLVQEGTLVKAGDVIAELDPARFEASAEEMEARVLSLKATIDRLDAELDEKPLVFSKEVESDSKIVSSQRNLYDRRRQLQREEQSSIEKSLKLAQDELDANVRLEETGDASVSEVLRARRQANELRAMAVNKRNAYRQDAQAELARSRSELEQATQVLSQRQQALASTRIRAPMAGAVKNIRITTRGAVLRAGEELMQIVPSDEPFIIEAKVRSADVAFVRNGLKANVKLDSYDYMIYGSLKGHVSYISPDTLDDSVPGRNEQPYYRVHIRIDEMPSNPKNKSVEVLPGMTASVQIITGTRTVAQYLLKPLRRVSSEALVER